MLIKRIKASGFRNYQTLDVTFEKGINSLYGPNGSGKTNIVEAIDYLTIGKSFRADSDIELINFDSEFTKLEVEYYKQKDCEIKVVVSKEGKKIFNNGIELKKLSELPGNLIDVVFTPKDVLLFKDSPLVRRKLIDITLSSIDKKYLYELGMYKSLLKERNAILKDDLFDETYLDIITEKMITSQHYIHCKRKELLDQINELINKTYKRLDDEQSEIQIKYQTFVDEKEFDQFKKKALKKYNLSKETDMKRKTTSEGIHREDFKTYLNGHEIDLYGSQGQNRITCLALKLSIYEIIKKAIDDDPILILDDVLSELDENHQVKLIEYLKQVEQTFITCTETNTELKKYSTYEIVDNAVIRR